MPPARRKTAVIKRRLESLVDHDLDPLPRAALVRLMMLLIERPHPPDSGSHFPDFTTLRDRWIEAIELADPEPAQEKFLELYCHLHMHEAPYTPAERRKIDQTGGYWCHAGGLAPILHAGPWILPRTILADYGAGNGLQGLLLQKLYPHRRTVQIEISSKMIEIGRMLQEWLEIPRDRVEWLAADLTTVPPRDFDFIYIYRPLRPEGPGRTFYEQFADTVNRATRPVTIFSIADCLRAFLPPSFRVIHSDGHLTAFTNTPPTGRSAAGDQPSPYPV